MPEINALAVIVGLAIIAIGPGSGVWVAMKSSIKVLRADNERTALLLEQINQHLETLNSRVSKSEDHIEGLERREDT